MGKYIVSFKDHYYTIYDNVKGNLLKDIAKFRYLTNTNKDELYFTAETLGENKRIDTCVFKLNSNGRLKKVLSNAAKDFIIDERKSFLVINHKQFYKIYSENWELLVDSIEYINHVDYGRNEYLVLGKNNNKFFYNRNMKLLAKNIDTIIKSVTAYNFLAFRKHGKYNLYGGEDFELVLKEIDSLENLKIWTYGDEYVFVTKKDSQYVIRFPYNEYISKVHDSMVVEDIEVIRTSDRYSSHYEYLILKSKGKFRIYDSQNEIVQWNVTEIRHDYPGKNIVLLMKDSLWHAYDKEFALIRSANYLEYDPYEDYNCKVLFDGTNYTVYDFAWNLLFDNVTKIIDTIYRRDVLALKMKDSYILYNCYNKKHIEQIEEIRMLADSQNCAIRKNGRWLLVNSKLEIIDKEFTFEGRN